MQNRPEAAPTGGGHFRLEKRGARHLLLLFSFVVGVALVLVVVLALGEEERIELMQHHHGNQSQVLVMTRLNHKHVVRAVDFFETAEVLYLVMELCSGGELYAHILKVGRLPEDEVGSSILVLRETAANCLIFRDLNTPRYIR